MANNQTPCAVITGANGGIGQALVRAFELEGYAVIPTDLSLSLVDLPRKHFIQADLQQIVIDEDYADGRFAEIRKQISGAPLKVLINNAAIQMLGKVEHLTRKDWQTTLEINLLAPFFFAQALLPELEESRGCIINISSIHARLTKREFAAYATSKAALSGLTRSLALEMGDRVRVNAIEPAAIDTDMLKVGFEDRPDEFSQLKQYHPTQCIGKPEEIGRLAIMLASEELSFLNGVTVPLDGGISGCLHDPS